MNYEEFKHGVLSRENRDFDSIRPRFTDRNIRLLHGVIGINTEVGELIECGLKFGEEKDSFVFKIEDAVNFVEELGDLQFYLALVMDCLDISLTDLYHGEHYDNLNDMVFDLQTTSYNLLDMCKKVIFYGKDLDLPFFLSNLSKLNALCEFLAKKTNTTISEVRGINNEKLRLRYGEKFSEEAAINRDLTKERQLLEGK